MKLSTLNKIVLLTIHKNALNYFDKYKYVLNELSLCIKVYGETH